MSTLFSQPLSVLNVGVGSFAQAIRQAGGEATQIEWAPPANGDRAAGAALSRIVNHPRVEAANAKAVERLLAAQPRLQGIGIAGDALPGMGKRMILHAGPPIEWTRMCGPMKGAIVGAILLEGWADSEKEAQALAAGGKIDFEPCHHHAAVGPMAGIISPSMPVWVVKNATDGNLAYSNLNEGLGKVLRFGANSPEVIARLKWMQSTLAPTLRAGLDKLGELELKPLMAQALHMGDEVHNRNAAASALLIKRLVPALLKSGAPASDVAATIEFMAANDHFFLNISMAACKSMLDAAHGVPDSSLVTVMARNGVDFGIRVSGLGERWFTSPAPVVDGLYFAGYSMADAAPDLGDSAITETAGPGRLRDGGGARDRQVRRRQRAGRARQHAGDDAHHAEAQRRIHAAGAGFCGHALRHRRAARGRYRDPAGHQHRHRAQGARRRTDRRGRHARALACFTQAVSALARSIESLADSVKA